MNASKNNNKSHWHSGFRMLGAALMLALTIYFLPLHHSNSSVIQASVAGPPAENAAAESLTARFPFAVELLSYAKAATTTLQITKSGPAQANPGDKITYQLTISNTGSAPATEVNVKDYHPANSSSWIPSGPVGWFAGNDPGGFALWFTSDSVGGSYSLPAGNSDTLSLDVTLDSPLPNGTIIKNITYTVVASNATVVNGSPVITTLVRAPEFGPLRKSVTPTTVTPGNLLTYTLVVSNVGDFQATNVVVTDTIPAHTRYISSNPPATVTTVTAGSVITWGISQLNVGQTVPLTLVVRTDSVITNGVVIQNSDYRASSSSVFTPAVGVDVASATVSSQPALTITKTASAATVNAGDYLSYAITVTNQSSATDFGRNIVVTDALPANSVFAGAGVSSGAATINAPPVGSSGTVTWTITSPANLNAGQSVALTLTVRAQSPLDNGTVLTNTYGLTAANLAAPISGPPVTTTVTSSPRISITKTVQPSSTLANKPITYTIIITNSGNATAANIPITDTLPSGFSPISATWTATITGVDFTGQPQVLTFTLPATTGSTGGDFANVVTATVGGVDISSGPVATVTVVPQVFSVDKIAGHNPVTPGTTLTYTLKITNETAFNRTALVTETYPAEVTFTGASPAPDSGNNQWTRNLGPNASDTILITVTVTSPLTNGLVFTNTAEVGNLVGSPTVSDTAASTVTSAPQLQISKQAAPSPAQAGQTLTYTIRFTNTGTAVASGLRITDTLPASVTYNSTSGPAPDSTTGGQLVWQSNLPASLSPLDGAQSITVTVTVTQPVVNGAQMMNQVDIWATGPVTDSYRLTTTINSQPVWSISKVASSSPVAVGSVLTYTITYTNSGTAVANNVRITDTLDSNVSFNGATNGGTESSPGVVVWTNPSVAPDSVSHTVQVSVTVAAGLANNTTLANNFAIASNETPTPTSGSINTQVQAPALSVSKTVLPAGFVRAGETVTYTIVYTNSGPIAAANVLITDTYPLSISGIISSSTDAVFQSSPSAGVLVWQDASLPGSNGSGSITLQGQLAATSWPAAGQTLTNSVVVASGSYSATTDTPVQARPGPPATISVVALPPSQQVGNNVAVMTSAKDQYGNPVFNGTAITFTTSLVGSGFVNPVMNSSGGAATGVLSSTVAGTSTVRVQTGASGLVSATTVVTFTPGAAANLLLSATSPQTAGVSFPITFTLVDSFGNRLTTFTGPITVTDSTGTLSPGGATLVNGTATTNFAVTAATSPASDTITGTTGSVTGTVAVEILPDTSNLQLALAAQSPIRVCESGLLTATLTDIHSNPVGNQSITFLYDAIDFQPPSGVTGTTNSSGVAVLTLSRVKGTNPQFDPVNAQLTSNGAVQGSASVGTLPADPASTLITVTVSPASISANGTDTATVSAQVGTCAGPVADGTVVTFTLSPALDVSPASPFTATTSGGVASHTLTAGVLTGTVTITGETSGKSDTATLTLLQPGAATLSITKSASPAGGNVLTGSAIQYSVSVQNTGSTAATGVVITDNLDSSVNFVTGSNSSNGTFNINSGQITVNTASVGAGQWLTATWQVTVSNVASGTLINNTANANSDTTALITSTTVTHRVITPTSTASVTYLPIVIKNCCSPNLIISQLSVNTAVSPPVLTVVVKNMGDASTGVGFWVDAYIDPSTPPANLTGGDRRWQTVSSYGIAWPVSTPLAVGQSITLTSTSGFDPAQINWPPPSGNHSIYAFADSFDADGHWYVEIFETSEGDNQAGPQNISILSGAEVGSAESPPGAPPPRRDLGR